VQGILQVQKDQLDLDYLEQAAEQRGVSKLLDRALKEADL
jgi:hypothetical protein